MKGSILLEIGGIRFAVENEMAGDLKHFEPPYRLFIKDAEFKPDAIDFKINLCSGRAPDAVNFKKIFDSGQSWSLYQNGNGYFLTIGAPAFKHPFLSAIIDQDFTESDVYVSKEFISGQSSDHLLINPVCYPLDQILMIFILAKKKGALFHAAGIGINGSGYMFPGKSGAGKSTITRQFVEKGGIDILSDDRIIARKCGDDVGIYGTPWPGEAGFAVNNRLPLSGIFFIAHGTHNRIRKIASAESLKRFLPVVSIPWYDNEIMHSILNFCEDLILKIPCYELYFTPSTEIADFVLKFESSEC